MRASYSSAHDFFSRCASRPPATVCNQISAKKPPAPTLSVKGVRDIASGLFIFILIAAGATHLLGWVILAATIIPLADATIVLGHGGSKSVAYGVHGLTAAVMLVTSALLLIS